MKIIEITPRSIEQLDDMAEEMACAYKYDFAKEPWNEVSRCINTACRVGFSACATGTPCLECNEAMVEAYDTTELITNWRKLVQDENGFMEIAVNGKNSFLRTTIARPTTPEELSARKYGDDEGVRQWLDQSLPRSFVWIEDTFANLRQSPNGNMVGRGKTLARIALRYCGNDIVTRTKVEAIVCATTRDAGPATDMWLGTNGAGKRFAGEVRSIGSVPDARTVLRVDGKQVLR